MDEFTSTIVNAVDSFEADGKTCPKCHKGMMRSTSFPDEFYGTRNGKPIFSRIERFECTDFDCDHNIAVRDIYILQKELRVVEQGTAANDLDFDDIPA